MDDIMETIEAIKTRRSVRAFTNEDVNDDLLGQILEAGRWAPSGLNNQAWCFITVRNTDTKVELSKLTHYGHIIKVAPLVIAVFLDKEHMYHYVKDVQSIGAAMQNMLLATHSLGLGGVWLGEILNNREQVNKVLEVPDSFELMGLIAIGHPVSEKRKSERKQIGKITFREKFGKQW